jgi:hypothetical protein
MTDTALLVSTAHIVGTAQHALVAWHSTARLQIMLQAVAGISCVTMDNKGASVLLLLLLLLLPVHAHL